MTMSEQEAKSIEQVVNELLAKNKLITQTLDTILNYHEVNNKVIHELNATNKVYLERIKALEARVKHLEGLSP